MAKKIDLKEISTKLSDSRKELLNLRFKKTSGQLENSSQFKKVKKNIAQLLTREKQLKIKGQSNV
mgnify:CR=1 FL=1